MSLESVSHKVIRNSICNSIGRIWTMGLAFLITPYVIGRLGAEQYGVWVLVFALLSYVALLDFGVGEAVIKYLAEYAALQKWADARRLMGTGLAFYVVLSICLAAITWRLRTPVFSVFKIPTAHWEDGQVVLLSAVILLCLANLANVFQSALIGIQRMDALNLTAIATASVSALTTVAVLETGHGLMGLALVAVGVSAVKAIILWAAVRYLAPELRTISLAADWKSIRTLLAYGIRVQVTNLGAVVNLEAPKLLLGYFVGLSLVTVYEIGFKVAYSLASLLMVLLVAVAPAVSALATRADQALIRQLYRQATSYVVLLVSPLGSWTIICAPAILLAWMGPGYEGSTSVIRALTVAFTLSIVLTGVGTAVVRGIGRPDLEMRYALAVIMFNLALSVPLTMWFGMHGVLTATVTATMLGALYFLFVLHKYLDESVFDFARQSFAGPILGCLIAGSVTWLAGIPIHTGLLPTTRVAALMELLLQGIIFWVIYGAVLLKVGRVSLENLRRFFRFRQPGWSL